MEKYSDYIIVHAVTAGEVSEKVKQYLQDGWVVLGAPFSHSTEGGIEICQAMVKQDTTRSGMIGFNR